MTNSAVKKAEDVVSTMLAKGFVLGMDTFNRAKSLDEKHQLTLNASAAIASIDCKMGLSKKLIMGTAVVNEKVKEMNEILQVSEMTKSALAAAEHKASGAGSALMSNRYMSTGASWITSALNVFSRVAEDVGTMTKEKVKRADEEKMETIAKEREEIDYEYGNERLDGYNAIPENPVGEANRYKLV